MSDNAVVIKGSKSYRIVLPIVAVATILTMFLVLWYQPSIDPEPVINPSVLVILVALLPLEIALILSSMFFNITLIEIDSRTLKRRNMFGFVKTYECSELSHENKSQSIHVFHDGIRVFRISYMFENFDKVGKYIGLYVPRK